MDFTQLNDRAWQVRQLLAAHERRTLGREWTRAEIMQGFVVDVGDLLRLTMAREGARRVEGVDQAMAHELGDCLWSLLVLARLHGVDLERAFLRTMDELAARHAPGTGG